MKSKAGGKGPFSGLKIQLGGAFAGYFFIFLILVKVIGPQLQSTDPNAKKNFEMRGYVHNQEGNSADHATVRVLQKRDGTLIEEKLDTADSDGKFCLKFADVLDADQFSINITDPKTKQTINQLTYVNPAEYTLTLRRNN